MRPLHIVMAIAVAAGWGFNFVAAKIGVQELPPLLLLTIRFVIVSAMLLPFVPRPTIPLKYLFAQSFLLGTLHFGMLYGAISRGLDASSATIATQLGVPFSCLLGTILFNDRMGRWRATGMLISFIGVIVIAGTPAIMAHSGPFLIGCIAALAWAFSNIVIKKSGEVPIFTMLAYMSLFAVPQLFLLSVLLESGHWPALGGIHWQTWAALAYTVIFSTLMAYGFWYMLLKRYPVSMVTPFSLLVPVFGIGSAQLFFDEALSPQFFIGAAIVLLGVGIILLRIPKIGILEK